MGSTPRAARKESTAGERQSLAAAPGGVEPQGVFSRYVWQTYVLCKKNYLTLRRKPSMTAMILFAPFVFMFLMFVIDEGYRSQPALRNKREVRKSFDPQSLQLKRCIPGPDDSTCLTIAYAPTGYPYDTLVQTVSSTFQIPASEVRGFPTIQACEEFVFGKQNFTQAAYLFYQNVSWTSAVPQLTYTIAYNDSNACTTLDSCNAPMDTVVVPMMAAMDNVLFQSAFGASLSVSPVAMPRRELVLLNIINIFGQPLIFMCIMFLFLSLLTIIIHEKEAKLRLSMQVMGLKRLPFWLSYTLMALVMLILIILILSASGAMFQFRFFLKNAFGTYFFLLLLSGMGIIMMGFFFSVFISTAKAATSFGFLFFLLFWIGDSFAVQILYNPGISVPEALRVIFALLPPVVLYKGLSDLSNATASEESSGISWSQIGSYTDIFPLQTLYKYAILDFFIFAVLLTYFDHVVAGDYGIAENYLFFLTPSYWGCVSSKASREKQKKSSVEAAERLKRERQRRSTVANATYNQPQYVATHAPPQQPMYVAAPYHYYQGYQAPPGTVSPSVLQPYNPPPYSQPAGTPPVVYPAGAQTFPVAPIAGQPYEYIADPDVIAEEDYVCSEDAIDNYVLRVVNLQKVYYESKGCSCACFGRKKKAYHAVRGISFGIPQGEMFVLLGANGAGKSTTFNMLTGVHTITSGDAFIHGMQVGSNMDAIRRYMGVCPQHDILFEYMTASEHLELFATLKGMKRSLIASESDRRLAGVDLSSVANVVSGSFSGGMRRRLSCAISLIGDPLILYLDEPSTGLDPISRRALWGMLEEAKTGRAMMLTTHSMEEADVLGDRIAIMAKGKIRCLGSSLHLKNKFGAGYRLSFTMADVSQKPAVLEFVRTTLPEASIVYDVGSVIVYRIPREISPRLSSFFRQLENERSFTRVDHALSITTLEEVFLSISEKARDDEARRQASARQ
eukprot:ANDGO_05443.mRNA.1 hypothetical protein